MDRPHPEDTIAQQPITHTPSTCLAAVSALSASHSASASLPPFTLIYLAEGNANVIYTLHPATQTHPINTATGQTSHSPLTSHPQCTVLRLRKDLPFTQPAIEVLSAFRRKIQPLFADGFADVLVEQGLFRMSRETVESVDSTLREMEGGRDGEVEGGIARDGVGSGDRPVHRRGVYHPVFERECHGILMPNLLSLGANPSTPSARALQDGKDTKHNDKSKLKMKTRLLEFKAKWLLQSPSAPADAVRCRTCAVNALRRLKNAQSQTQAHTETSEEQMQTQTRASENSNQNHKLKQKQKHKLGRGDGGFCPFALLSNDKSTGTLHSALTTMGLFAHCRTPRAKHQLQTEFAEKVQPVLRHLRGLQGRFGCVGLDDFRGGLVDRSGDAGLDSRGAVDAGYEEGDFAVAMALRDCSVFLVIAEGEAEDEAGDGDEDGNRDIPSIKAVKLADLDLKTTGGGKLQRWAGIEEELIRSGMYTMSKAELEGLMGEGEGDVCVWREFEGR